MYCRGHNGKVAGSGGGGSGPAAAVLVCTLFT